ncbi:MAG TPA: enolase C-terminal domain-like protein, partial [Pirellulales bacterium]
LAESHYVSICPHNPNGPVATAASLHLLAAIPNCLMLETIGSPADYELHAQLAEHPNRPVNGRFKLPAGPGLGITLRAGAEQHLPYQPFKGHR